MRKFNFSLTRAHHHCYTTDCPPMSKRKVNFGAITSEAARRQLMVPTPCWERVSATPEDAAPGATWKVYKWVKTDRKQARIFSYSSARSSPS